MRLTVEAVWIIEGQDQATVSRLTVRPLSDGSFQYISNEVASGEDNTGWYRPRLSDEDWVQEYRMEAGEGSACPDSSVIREEDITD